MENRENMLDKIRALLAKTTANGCTEHEALAALDKARAMMDAYEVTEADLNLSKEEKAVFRKEPPGTQDPHAIKQQIATAVAAFCDCTVWRSKDGLTFCGMRSDAQLATYLTDTLAAFVQGELVTHLMGKVETGFNRRRVINGFVAGCCSRISERLKALIRQSAIVAASNSKALVVVKSAAVKAKMAEAGIHLRGGRSSQRSMDSGSYHAGRAAGERASFGRPISGNAGAARIGRN